MVITVDDFDRVVRFYRDTVGLSVDSEWDRDDGRGVLFDVGKATLEVFDRAQKESNDILEAGQSGADSTDSRAKGVCSRPRKNLGPKSPPRA